MFTLLLTDNTTELRRMYKMVLLLFFSAILFFFFYIFVKYKYNFWKNRNVKGPNPVPIVGNFGKVITQQLSAAAFLQKLYEEYPEEKIVGIYVGYKPVLLIRDAELIKHVLIKDFPLFQDRGVNKSKRKITMNLFSSEGEIWRILRQKLTPVFTSRKIKDMIPLIQQCADDYIKYVNSLSERNIDHEIRSLFNKYTLQAIGCCAFGLSLDTFVEKENEFGLMAHKLFNPSTFTRIVSTMDLIIPGIMKLFGSLNSDIFDFFVNLVTKVIRQREGMPKIRKDFMDLMIELKEQGKVSRKVENGVLELTMDDELITAQAIIFYAAGFETSSATMSFMIHELAWHQDVQNKVYREIYTVLEKHNGELTYDAIKEMTYLEQVFDETLRKYPVIGILQRVAEVDYTLPGTNVTVPKGTPVMISLDGLQNDKKFFANPDDFNPDNFSAENKNRLPPSVYMPFGEGPRNCIGMRFAIVQSKIGIAAFLKNFKVEPSTKTNRKLLFDPAGLTLTSLEGIWVKISKR